MDSNDIYVYKWGYLYCHIISYRSYVDYNGLVVILFVFSYFFVSIWCEMIIFSLIMVMSVYVLMDELDIMLSVLLNGFVGWLK